MFWTLCALLALFAGGCGGKKRQMKAMPRPIGWSESGIASWYGPPYHGRRAANGEVYDMERLTAAHRTLPFDTWVRVENLSNHRKTEVRITDRGPFVGDRIIDLSKAGARDIDMLGAGVTKVKITVIKPPRRKSEPEEPVTVVARPELPPAAPVPAANGSGTPMPSPPPTTPAPVESAERFGVQIAVLTNRANAERLRADMEQRFGSARLVEREGARLSWRVVVGELESEGEAAALLERLRESYADAFVVRID